MRVFVASRPSKKPARRCPRKRSRPPRKGYLLGEVPDRYDGLRNEAGKRVLTQLQIRDKEGRLRTAAIDLQRESSQQERSGQRALRPAVHLVCLCARSCGIVVLLSVASHPQVRPHLRSHTLLSLLPPYRTSDTKL